MRRIVSMLETDGNLLAVCNDGSVWIRDCTGNNWVRCNEFENVPQGGYINPDPIMTVSSWTTPITPV